MDTQERWKPVTHTPYNQSYEVSDRGNVRRRGLDGIYRSRKPYFDKNRMRVLLNEGNYRQTFLVHHLVWQSFCGSIPTARWVNAHLDGNPSNNALSNLRPPLPDPAPVAETGDGFIWEDLPGEIWKPVLRAPYHKYYEVSNLGRVRRVRFKWRPMRELNPTVNNRSGGLQVRFSCQNEKHFYGVHRLVWETFHDQPLSRHDTIMHRNGDKRDNRLANLQRV